MFWFRVDNRLVHGQVIEAWIPHLRARTLVVVNDSLAEDTLQQEIMQLAIPERIEVHFISFAGAKNMYQTLARNKAQSSLFLLKTCRDAYRMVEQGVPISVLNLGNMHYNEGKKQLCGHIAVSAEDISCLDYFVKKAVTLDFRCVPDDVPVLEAW